MKRTVIGMTAHVDAGKTTLSEAMLFTSGEIRKAGRVDKGDAFLDTHEIERSRGITVFSKQAVMHFGGNEYTLLDTPGHTDFSAEAERAISALDYAVLVISATDGVQSHTETIWRLLARYRIPTFIFVNKTDISQNTREFILLQLRARLSEGAVSFSAGREWSDIAEEAAALDEDIMNSFLEGEEITEEMMISAVRNRRVFPVCFGSALKMQGIEDFLSVIDRFTEEREYPAETGARVYKITTENGVRLTHLKITGGSLKVRSSPEGCADSEKITRIRVYSGVKFSSPEEVFPGTLCAVEGLDSSYAGMGLGAEHAGSAPMLEPVLSYRVCYPANIDAVVMLANLRRLEEEDPQLHVVWNEQLSEIYVRLMGEIQLEILRHLVMDRFSIPVDFDKGSIAYKETIAAPAVGIGHYEPLRHYAEVHLLLEPAEQGSGITFSSECSEDILARNWQRLILSNLEEKAHIGVLTGSPITDMKITLTTGKAHLKHTEGGDFRQASWRAVRNGLMHAKSVLLEPWYEFTLEVPSDCTGRAMTDLQRMNAEFSAPEMLDGNTVIKGIAPAVLMMHYHNEAIGYSHGKARLNCTVKGYFPCHNAEEVIAAMGYDPEADLDNSPDSVFCAHGAGYNVSWCDVPFYAHMDSGIRLAGSSEGSEVREEKAVSKPRSTVTGTDEELMAIFEQTYGKINRDKQNAVRRDRENLTAGTKHKAKPLPKGPEYLLVDGYNMIFAWDELKKMAEQSLDLARTRLTDILCNYRGYRQNNIILVFDAYRVKGEHREVEEVNGISVVYTKEAETADMYIEKTSHDLAKDHRVRVATSDGAEQIIIMGNGAFRVTAPELYEEIKAAEKSIAAVIASQPKGMRQRHEIKGADKQDDS